MSGTSAKKIVKWHESWLGEKDANGDLIRDWAQYFDKEQFKCRYCNVERKFSNGGRTSLIQHSESHKHKKSGDGKNNICEMSRFCLLNVEVIFKILRG